MENATRKRLPKCVPQTPRLRYTRRLPSLASPQTLAALERLISA